MEDITARIIVTAESSAAVQGLQNTKKALDEVAQARLRDLQMQKARARLELAEFESAEAAKKAAEVESPLRGAENHLASLKEQHKMHIELYKDKKSLGELDDKQTKRWTKALKAEAVEIEALKERVNALTKEYLPLANAEAAANLEAFNAKQKLDALSGSTEKAGNNVGKFSLRMLAARVASRVFRMDLGATSDNMIKYGIIAAGAASVVKLVKWGFEQMDKAMIENAELWKRNNENIKETAASWAEARNRQNEAIDTINQYNGQTEISAVDSLKVAKAIKTLGSEFGDLGVEIDQSTGRIRNFDKVSAGLKRKQINREQSEISTQLKNLENERRAQIELRDTAGVPVWGGDVRVGGEATMLAAGKEIERINNEMIKLRKRQAELKRLNPEKDAEDLRKKQAEDAAKTYSRRLGELKNQVEIQRLRNKGLEEGAKLLEINAKLDKERLGLSNDQQRAEFDLNRPLLIQAEMEQLKVQSEKYEKDLATRLKDMQTQNEVQRLRNQGLEKEATLLEINARLDKERLALTSNQDRAVFDRNRKLLVEAEMLKYNTAKKIEMPDIFKELAKFRATAQSAIDANSLEGQKLMSRRLTIGGDDWNKKTADGVHTIVGQLREIGKSVAQRVTGTAFPKVNNNVSVTTTPPAVNAQVSMAGGGGEGSSLAQVLAVVKNMAPNLESLKNKVDDLDRKVGQINANGLKLAMATRKY